jgi:hypothetical protein
MSMTVAMSISMRVPVARIQAANELLNEKEGNNTSQYAQTNGEIMSVTMAFSLLFTMGVTVGVAVGVTVGVAVGVALLFTFRRTGH